MNELTLTPMDIAPEIRGANYFVSDDVHLGPRYNFAYQLLYVFDGEGAALLNGRRYAMAPGFFTLYGPGDCHEFYQLGNLPMALATINFSWRRETSERLAMGNRTVAALTPEHRALADPVYRIDGLPPLPLTLYIPERERPELERLLRDTGWNYRHSGDSALMLRYKAALLLVLDRILRLCRGDRSEHPALSEFRRYIREHYMEPLDRDRVATACGISASHLTALLRGEWQTNFSAYLGGVRLEAARELLQFSMLSVKEIAERVGFADYSYFVACFRRRYGRAPGAWRSR